MVETGNRIIGKYLRPALKELFEKCTEGQQGKFIRIFGTVDQMETEKIPNAIALCERTIKKNDE